MRYFLCIIWACVIVLLCLNPQSSAYPPPPTLYPPDEATQQQIQEKRDKLAQAISKLKADKKAEAALPDVEIFHKAADWIAKHNEWFAKDSAKWTVTLLEKGLSRAQSLSEGKQPWLSRPGKAVRAYRSQIDGSVQPYAVILPKNYPGPLPRDWRLDVILHGRDGTINEVKFLNTHEDETKPVPEQNYVELHVYGRGNNGYRWAGEQDVLEAVAHFQASEFRQHKGRTIDSERIVLRGFSMGGAGAWHLGLHYPDKWCSVSPGAGFSHTGSASPKELPDYVAKCMQSYDAVSYAENIRVTPFVAYGGDKDPQLDAAKQIEAKAKQAGLKLNLLIGPNTEHKYHPDSLKEIMKLQAEHAAQPQRGCRKNLHFVTYSPAFGQCDWVALLQQEKHFERSEIQGQWSADNKLVVKTTNVRALRLKGNDKESVETTGVFSIDGQNIPVKLRGAESGEVYFEKQAGKWVVTTASALLSPTNALRKIPSLHGPIDHAFVGPFLCVRGTGKPWHTSTQAFASASLHRFEKEWDKWMRGKLLVKDDKDVTEDDLKKYHLIVFGDPGSNSLLKRALEKLPMKWTEKEITLAGQTSSSAEHVPVLIYPSPFNETSKTSRYLVVNSGHTFHTPDFEGTNRLLYPRLGDYALLAPKPTEKEPYAYEIIAAGLFDVDWRVKK